MGKLHRLRDRPASGMLDSVLEFFDVVPDIDLDLMQEGQTLTSLTSRVLTTVGDVLDQINNLTLSSCRVTQRRLWAQPWPHSTDKSLWGT